MIKILFFVEPVIYRLNPNMLANWISIINDSVLCSSDLIEAHIATSEHLLQFTTTDLMNGWSIPSFGLLEPFAFDRLLYMQDIYSGNGQKNMALLERLSQIRASVDPDVVICWTENAYVRRIFEGCDILFAEFGPVPRTGFVSTIHLDPCGHQIGSVFDAFRDPRWQEPDDHPAISLWYDHWKQQIRAAAQASELMDWIERLPANRVLKLAALQPTDWLTYEGSGVSSDPLSVLASVASDADQYDLVIPQWHPAQDAPNQALLEILSREYPALAIPPEHLRVGYSECLLPIVDEVITISSNVALAGSLLGCGVRLLGQSKFSALATAPGKAPPRRTDLVPILAAELCRPLDSWTRQRGGMVDHIGSALRWRNAILSRPDLRSSHVERLLN
jgi:hypothetical protein